MPTDDSNPLTQLTAFLQNLRDVETIRKFTQRTTLPTVDEIMIDQQMTDVHIQTIPWKSKPLDPSK